MRTQEETMEDDIVHACALTVTAHTCILIMGWDLRRSTLPKYRALELLLHIHVYMYLSMAITSKFHNNHHHSIYMYSISSVPQCNTNPPITRQFNIPISSIHYCWSFTLNAIEHNTEPARLCRMTWSTPFQVGY